MPFTNDDAFIHTASLHFLPRGVEILNSGPSAYEGRFRDPLIDTVALSNNQCFDISTSIISNTQMNSIANSQDPLFCENSLKLREKWD